MTDKARELLDRVVVLLVPEQADRCHALALQAVLSAQYWLGRPELATARDSPANGPPVVTA